MRETIKDAIGSTLQDLVTSGINTSFSEKELKEYGVVMPEVKIEANDIKEIRKKVNLSQTVFAKLLNVSTSSIRQWEQGKRKPSGSTKVLLELLSMQPTLLNYRIKTAHQNSDGN